MDAGPAAPLSDSAAGNLFAFAQPPRSSAHRWQPPTVEELQRALPQYRIDALAGRGGMGAVYKGWQKSLERPVAIKILPAEIEQDDAGFADRFKREAKAMARLSHPGIVAVHDAGETAASTGSGQASGLLYFVMDFVEGTDVQQMVAARGRLLVEEALAITAHVCDALAYAHGKGIIHRDIKPSNVMVDPEGQVKVADFGLAKIVSSESALLTASDVAMGTPDFMAPESQLGMDQVDHRADLYAVGVMLYQMLTGKLPRGRFDPPSRAVPGLDKSLDQIVDRALQNERDARYSSAIELRSALEPILTRTVARRTAAAASAQRSWKSPALLGALAVALATVAFIILRPSKPSVKPGLPEAEARKLAGITGDANQPPAPKQPSDGKASAAFPPGKWVKPFTKIEDFPANVRSWLSLDSTGTWLTPLGVPVAIIPAQFSGQNMGVRATFRREHGAELSRVHLRAQGTAADRRQYQFGVLDSAGKTQIGLYSESPFPDGKKLRNLAVRQATPVPGGGEYTLELMAVGSTLIARLDGQIVQQLEDSSLADGQIGLRCIEPFRDFEVINLDGLPEAEARKVAGLTDEAPKAAVSKPTSPPPAPADPVRFPPGQWVKAWERVEDIPNVGEIANGWVTKKPNVPLAVVRGASGKNWGVRARFRRGEKTSPPQLLLRNNSGIGYNVLPDNGALILRRNAPNSVRGGSVELKKFPMTIPTAGQEFVLEFIAIGQTLFARFDGQLVSLPLDPPEDPPLSGEVVLYEVDKNAFRDVEVINLDGLPEVEARKLAGVDVSNVGAGAPYPGVDAAGLVSVPAGIWTRYWPAELEPSRLARRDGEWALVLETYLPTGRVFKRAPMLNGGLRARFRGQRIKTDTYPQMNLRSQEGDGGSVNLFIEPGGKKLQLRNALKPSITTLAEVPLREPLVAGKEYLMEFYALGTTLVGRVDGQTVTAETTMPPLPGDPALSQVHNDFLRDLEILNLDGLPEAEARKLIGIDKP